MAGRSGSIPAGYHTVTPYLVIRDAGKAIEFYKKAFGADEVSRMPGPGGKGVMHAEMKIGDSKIMFCDEMPQMQRWVSPQSLNGTTVALHLYVQDVDAAFQRAVAAGATVSLPVMDTFWGDRFGKLTDPFGHEWSMATRQRELTPEQIRQGAEEFIARMRTKDQQVEPQNE